MQLFNGVDSMQRNPADDSERAGESFYQAAIRALQRARVPLLIGGAYALEVHAGVVRRTKDLDVFVRAEHVEPALSVLSEVGYRTELTFPHWLGKAFCAEHFIDLIFNSGNGICPVDDDWFRFARSGSIFGLQTDFCPLEETIWQKAFVLERDRCDVADIAHLVRRWGAQLDWHRLLRRFGPRWRVLLAQLLLFEFVYPGHRDEVPAWVMEELTRRELLDRRQPDDVPASRECHGTLLSAVQYLQDVDLEGYSDPRLPPSGAINRDHLAVWTANFMKPG